LAADKALDGLASDLSVSRAEAAEGVHRVINTQMAEGIRLVSVRRGVDPRKFALLSFGGAAGIHITDIARQLEVKRVVVPRTAAVLSAWGMLATDLRYEVSRTHIGDAGSLDANSVRTVFDEMEKEGRDRLAQAFDGVVGVKRSADMRYGEQIYEIDVSLDGVDFLREDLMAEIATRFHARHNELFTYSLPEQEAVLVNGRLAAIGKLPSLPEEPKNELKLLSDVTKKRDIYLSGWREVSVFDLEQLSPGQKVLGPAIIESVTTTIVLRDGDEALTTDNLWLDVSVGRQ
jgi:N-methylhydantoinase A